MILVIAGVLALAPLEPQIGRPADFDDVALGDRVIAHRRLELWHVDRDVPFPSDLLAIERGGAWHFAWVGLDGETRRSERILDGTLADGSAAIVLEVVTDAKRHLLVCSLATSPACGELEVGHGRVRLRAGVLRVGSARYVL